MLKKASNTIEERMRLIIDTIPTMAWSLRPDGAVDFVNKALAWNIQAFLLKRSLKNPTSPVQSPRPAAGHGNVAFGPWPLGNRPEDEMRLQRADGNIAGSWCEPYRLRNEQGCVVKWYGVSTDNRGPKASGNASRWR